MSAQAKSREQVLEEHFVELQEHIRTPEGLRRILNYVRDELDAVSDPSWSEAFCQFLRVVGKAEWNDYFASFD